LATSAADASHSQEGIGVGSMTIPDCNPKSLICPYAMWADAEIKRLHYALKLYGDHTYECEMKENKDCSCGYEDACK
jgi:hypothetical protein